MKYMRRTAGYTWTDYKTNTQITKELKITPILDKIQEYKRSWIQHVNRMPRNRLPRLLKHYSPTGRRNHGRPLKRLLDTWDRNGSTSGPTPWQIDDDDDYDDDEEVSCFLPLSPVCCMAAVQAIWLQCSPLIQNITHCSRVMFHILICTIQNGCKLGAIWSTCPFTLFVCPVWLVGKEHKEDWYLPRQMKSLLRGNITGRKLSRHWSSILVNEAGTA